MTLVMVVLLDVLGPSGFYRGVFIGSLKCPLVVLLLAICVCVSGLLLATSKASQLPRYHGQSHTSMQIRQQTTRRTLCSTAFFLRCLPSGFLMESTCTGQLCSAFSPSSHVSPGWILLRRKLVSCRLPQEYYVWHLQRQQWKPKPLTSVNVGKSWLHVEGVYLHPESHDRCSRYAHPCPMHDVIHVCYELRNRLYQTNTHQAILWGIWWRTRRWLGVGFLVPQLRLVWVSYVNTVEICVVHADPIPLVTRKQHALSFLFALLSCCWSFLLSLHCWQNRDAVTK